MKLSKTSAQAALAVGYLASRRDDGPIQARQVAGYLGVPTDSALKILQALARRDVIQSRMGRGGGYTLTREPDQLTLLEVIEAVEGPITARVGFEAGDEAHDRPLKVLEAACRESAEDLRERLSRCSMDAVLPDTRTNTPDQQPAEDENNPSVARFSNRLPSVA